MYYDLLEERLYAAVEESLTTMGLPLVKVLFASGDALEPSRTYCVLNILGVEQIGRITGTQLDPDGNVGHPTYYKALVQFTVIGGSARQVAPTMRQSIVNNTLYRNIFLKNGLSQTYRSGLRNIPQKRDTEWIECFNFDIHFNFMFVDYQEMDSVDSVIITGTTIV